MLKDTMKKVGNMQEQRGNTTREAETPRKNPKEMREIKTP